MHIEHKHITVIEYAKLVNDTMINLAKGSKTSPICDLDVSNALSTIELLVSGSMSIKTAMGVALTIFFEKGYREGIEAAEIRLQEVDKKLERQ